MRQNIKCPYHDTIVGSVDLAQGEVYKGDLYYNMLCSEHITDLAYPKILDLVNTQVAKKNIHDINYITELATDSKLHSIQTFTNDGFLSLTEFYIGYISSSDKGDIVLIVDEEYITNAAQAGLDPCAREIVSRLKTRTWIKTDGTNYPAQKITLKLYDTRKKKAAEGERRRGNITDRLVENVGLAGVLSGVFADAEDANESLTALLETHSTVFNTYYKTGRGTIFDAILADNENLWLSSVVADTAYTQLLCPWMIGMTFRNYIIEKLKGNIK